MYHPRTDVTKRYQYVPVDFIKHLFSTTVVVGILAAGMSAIFHEPVRPALKIQQYATTHPRTFESVALDALNGTGSVANYGPPYNHGTGSVQDVIQKWVGILHPVNAREVFVLRPLAEASHLVPSLKPALARFDHASPTQQAAWEAAYGKALSRSVKNGSQVSLAHGTYGPLATMMPAMLHLGQTGFLSGALDRTPAEYSFDNQNSLLFLQGRPLQNAAHKLELLGNQWGIIHEERAPFPGPWWMTIVTAIYQIPYIANASAADAMALGGGMMLFVILMFAPWIPVLNRLPRYLGVHRLIWRNYYQTHEFHDEPKFRQGGPSV